MDDKLREAMTASPMTGTKLPEDVWDLSPRSRIEQTEGKELEELATTPLIVIAEDQDTDGPKRSAPQKTKKKAKSKLSFWDYLVRCVGPSPKDEKYENPSYPKPDAQVGY